MKWFWPIQLYNDTSVHTGYCSQKSTKLWLSIVPQRKVNNYELCVLLCIAQREYWKAILVSMVCLLAILQ